MKKQKILQGIAITFLLITIVTAGVLDSLKPADFIAPEQPEKIRYEGEITFLVDGKPASCYLNEPNLEIDDDFEEDCLKNYEGKRITNITDWTNRKYQEVEIDGTTYRSFNESKLIALGNN